MLEQDYENEYNSDCNNGPFYDCIDKKGEQDYDEDNELHQFSLEPDHKERSEEEDVVKSTIIKDVDLPEDKLIKFGVSI